VAWPISCTTFKPTTHKLINNFSLSAAVFFPLWSLRLGEEQNQADNTKKAFEALGKIKTLRLLRKTSWMSWKRSFKFLHGLMILITRDKLKMKSQKIDE
jgi:hypothetical protein